MNFKPPIKTIKPGFRVGQIVVSKVNKSLGRISRIEVLNGGSIVVTVLPSSGGSLTYYLTDFERLYRLQNRILRIV